MAFAAGTTAPLVSEWLNGNTLVNVTSLTITIEQVGSVTPVLGPTGTGIVNTSAGIYLYDWAIPSATPPGDYTVTWSAAEGTAVEVISVTPPEVTVNGWTPNIGLCSAWGGFSSTVQTYATDFAATLMWAATGRQFGLTDVTLRPCWNPQMPTYITYPSIWNAGQYGGQYAWGLFAFSGNFALLSSCGCGLNTSGSACGCDPPQIELPMPAYQIISITEDGTVLAPSAYRLDGNALVRQDGKSWNYRQNLAAPLGQTGTWSVRYYRGVPVPTTANDAAGILACEVAKSLTGQTCRLSRQMTSMTRQGVTAQFASQQDFLDKGFTGILEVDQVIRLCNPRGLTHPPRVVSLDGPQFREVSP